jgi:hypothetical protein
MSAKLKSRNRPTQAHAATTSDAIRQFHVNVPESELSELRKRISATRWPQRKTVTKEGLCRLVKKCYFDVRYFGKCQNS